MRFCFILALATACGPGEPSDHQAEDSSPAPSNGYLDAPAGELPAGMRELGLYPDLGRFDRAHARAIEFRPAFELWSNGSTKQRFFVPPLGQAVDNSERENWRFPIGSLFVKTFFFERPIETRVLRRTEQGFDYAVYLWNEAGTDAELTDLSRPIRVAVELDGERFEHLVPSRLDCRKCHESQPVTVIGFDELRLNAPRAEGLPTQLAELDARELFAAPLPEVPDAVMHEDPLTREALGYLHGNCAHCHNGGSGASSAFDMRHSVALESLIDRETEGEALAGIRVVPGEPEASALYLALARREIEGIQPMPPVGVERADEAGIALIRDFIAGLESSEPGMP